MEEALSSNEFANLEGCGFVFRLGNFLNVPNNFSLILALLLAQLLREMSCSNLLGVKA
jgi:hypothetical protein